jgi:acyl carrier protein
MSRGASVADRIVAIFHGSLHIDVPSTEADLIEAGLVDSLALVELLAAIEQEFGIELPIDGLEVDTFRTVDAMAAFVVGCIDGDHPGRG